MMKREEKLIFYNNLYDIYGSLLNEREKEIFNLFYEEDLSMQEIADVRGVSKSAIGSAIKTINKKLDDYEEKLKIFKLKNNLKKELINIENKNIRERITKIID